MVWTLPDKGAGDSNIQSILFSEYLKVLTAGVSGIDCVKSGCAVTAQASPDMTLAVAAGVVISNGAPLDVSSGNVTITTADSTNPRLDLVVVNSSGTKAVRAGTAASAPVPPTRTANDVVLAVVYVPATDTAISNSQIADLRVLRDYPSSPIRNHFICLSSTNTLTSGTTAQPIFDSVGAGQLTLDVGLYFFDSLISVSSMSATSGNAAINLLGSGTATLGSILYHGFGIDGATASPANQTGSMSVSSASASNILTAGTGTSMQLNLKGTFRVTAAGTIIPSIALTTANAAVVAIGSYFRCELVGTSSVQASASWS